ncbi:carbohydrate ABC transporter ATP-binding protein (CUT1 family) [Palleronia aestuarii]|uniref:Carbohydrate ABC transporter ATP-binding protein (CUT1 family) n=1 Tax=Palleronia aestuarii TaxID=568105 RepID=A0A2W7MUK7_9RHOB|nr:sn-glycerol-3-phosphate ABC transporter ATP-binding protein UgpC [Palleronia aestuarii]PZX11718.1 carbohydrate ABC transporter ATP-binding protein (CUT1 family) [Palleronia aestuarii]
MTGIVLDGIGKTFDGTRIFDDLSLSIRSGELIVFVGPSGCGKSTLLRLIAGLETATEGRIEIDGRDVTQSEPHDRGLSMVFQSYALYPHMTVQQNIAFALHTERLPRDEISARVAEAARILKIEPYLDRKPKALSGGQRQRVAIGRAIVREPKAFLFDEPLSNLDAALRADTRVEIAELHKRLGATMLYVTHDQVEAMTLADRIVVLKAGRIMQIGTPHDLYTAPANTFVAQFIGSPRMNLLPCEQMDSTRIRLPGGSIEIPSLPCRPAQIGIRPEDLNLVAPTEGRLRGQVVLTEYLGADRCVHIDLGEVRVTLRDAGSSPKIARDGEEVGLAFDPRRAHYFDAAGDAINVISVEAA